MSELPLPVAPEAPAGQPLELSYVSLAGSNVLPATRENVSLLQHAADYQVCARNLRVSGVGDIIWGVICCVLGGLMFRFQTANIVLIIFGAVLIGVGIWLVSRPTPLGMIVDGALLVMVGIWNLYINYLVLTHARVQGVGIGPVIAIAQIGWGIHRLRSHSRFASAVAMQPSEANVQLLRQLVQSTLKAKTKQDPTVISFRRRSSFTAENWKARLLPEIAVFAMSIGQFGGRRDALLAARDGVEISETKKKLLSRRYKLTLRVGQRTLKVVMHEQSLQRLNDWIANMPAPAIEAIRA